MKYKYKLPGFIFLWVFSVIQIKAITPEEIIKAVDKNAEFKTQSFGITMKIEKGARTLIKKIEGYGMTNGRKSFMKFINPEDDGVKYLKIEKELWIYFPDADDIMKISGHMLRQGMMGSDISYEDMMESGEWEKKYSIRLLPEETIENIECYVVELKAKVSDVAYEKQIMAVDKKNLVPLKVDMYSAGGRLIKKITFHDFINISGRITAQKVIIKDTRKKDSLTTMEFAYIKFNEKLPPKVFTKEFLRR
ncbi:MAG: outer membrane lipoprotein-sorting protein [Spirochaetia bacterium]|nr:outer membrane lipoprotein-sorting protein [Spirochaetia bacterium]